METLRKILRFFLKVCLWLACLFLLVFGLVWLVLKVPGVQNYLVDKATSYVSAKTHSRVELGRIDLAFPKSLLLQELYLDDANQDTLLYLSELEVDIDMLALVSKKINVNYIGLEGLHARIIRDKQKGEFNFQFLLDAFSKEEKEKVQVEDTTSSPWGISARSFEMKNCRFLLDDSLSGVHLRTRIPAFEITVDRLDLTRKILEINEVLVSDVSVQFATGISMIPDAAAPGKNPLDKVLLSHLEVRNTDFSMDDEVKKTSVKSRIGNLRLEDVSMDLLQQIIRTGSFEMAQSGGKIRMIKDTSSVEKQVKPSEMETGTGAAKKTWLVEVQRVRLDSNSFSLDYTNIPSTPKGIDFNHLALSGLTADIKEVYYDGNKVRSLVDGLAVQEKSGFGIRSLRASFDMDSVHTNLDNFEVVTNYSRLGQQLRLSYPSLAKLAREGTVKVLLKDNELAVRDLLLLAPQLETNKFISRNSSQKIKLDAEASGSMKELNLMRFVAVAGQNTVININGKLRNVQDPDKLFMDLNIRKIQSSSADLQKLLPDNTVPASVKLPAVFAVAGRHKGGTQDFWSDLVLTSSAGRATILSDIRNLRSPMPSYSVDLQTSGFQAGQVIGQSSVGQLTATVKVRGKGLDKNKAVATANVNISSVTLQNYTYRNIILETAFNKGLARIKADVNDTNLALALNAEANVLSGQEACRLDFRLKGIDLYRLHLTPEHIQVSANVDADLKGNSSSNFEGDMAIRNIMVVKKNKEYKLDSLMIASVNQPSLSSMTMTSSVMSASFNGNIDLLSVATVLKSHLNNYFKLDERIVKSEDPQNFDFKVKLNEDPFVREVLLPALTDYRAVTIKGGFDSRKDKLELNLDAPYVEYAGLKVKDVKLDISSDSGSLSYNAGIASFIGGSLQLEATSLYGSVADDTALVNLKVAKKGIGNKLLLKSQLVRNGKYFRYSLLPDGFNIMDQAWEVNPENFIEFGAGQMLVHELGLSNGPEMIRVNSSSAVPDADMLVLVKDFRLKTLSQIAEQKDSLFKGTLDGTVTFKNYKRKPAFVSDLMIKDLHYKTSAVGDLRVRASNLNSARYSIDAVLQGFGNDVKVTGFFNPEDTSKALDFTAAINAIQLASVESFTGGELRRSSGKATGNFTIRGSTSRPSIRGGLVLSEARTNVRYLNQTLYMQNESLSLSEKGIHFETFEIRDSLNNVATITGDILMHQFKDIKFDMRVTSGDFLVLNTTAVQNKLYYGKVILDSDIKIKGTPHLPKITAEITVVDGSQFTFAVPESKLTVDRGEGVVVFLYDPSDMHPIMLRREKEVIRSPMLTGMDLTARVKVKSGSKFKILVDPVSGDSLVVSGDADIHFGIDPSGKVSLSGIYEINDGKYKAFIEGITTKEFLLVKGSKIIWNGDPLDAMVDMKAQYNVKTSPRELMSIGGSGGLSVTDSSLLARSFTFQVFLIIQGQLLKPELSFSLDMAENQRHQAGNAIYSKLQEINQIEAERNKQVFSLLVLNKFMATNAPGGGTTASGFARSSVSRMMSDQLNQLSSQYLKGVEVNVDLQSYDYSQGGHTKSNTQANVSVRKNFDRLSVQVGSNVRLEGANAQRSNSKNFTGDIEIDYKLTKDGRYQAKAFRQNEIDAVANGVVTETGVGIMYTKSYNKTRELFRWNRRKKKEQADEKD